MSTTAYKMLDMDGSAPLGSGKAFLPKGNRPGKWMPRIDTLVACESGYHLARTPAEVLAYAAPVVWRAEYRGDVLDAGDKIVVSQYRLLPGPVMGEREWRLFAADCAERVLPLFEAACPNDYRPRRAIEVARLFANGDAARSAGDAAWSAARDTARSAARDAAWAAWSAARDTAWSAARDTAWSARDAAGSARSAEREWQRARLSEYLEGTATT